MNKGQRKTLMAYFGLTAIQALVSLFLLIRIPSDPKNAVFLGLSLERWALLSIPFLLLAFSARSLFTLRRGSTSYDRILARLTRSRSWGWITVLSGAIGFFSIIFILVTTQGTPFVFAPRGVLPELEIDAYFVDLSYFQIENYLPRLLPLAILLFGLCIQNIIFFPAFALGWKAFGAKIRAVSLPATILGFILAVAAFFLADSQLQSLGADIIGWNTIGGPILETQVAGVLAIGLFLLIAGILLRGVGKGLLKKYSRLFHQHGDKIIFILIWVIAAFHWNAIPLQPSWYLSAPQPPTNSLVPNSDALVYELTAQNMLVGEELQSRAFDEVVVRRPVYVFLLGLLHAAAGQDTNAVSALQGTLLALFPAVVYLIGRDMRSRLAGLMAAALIVWREGNTIALANQITVSHSRLFMSDLPTALGVALAIWLILRWLDASQNANSQALAAGAVIGGLVMIRIETALLLPFAGLFALVAVRGNWKNWLPGMTWLMVGAILAVTPWLIRNYAKSGEIYFEVPGNRFDFVIQRFKTQGNETEPEIPDKVDPRAVLQTDEGGLGRITAHFLHSNLQSILIFPTSLRLVDASFGYTQTGKADNFWESCCSRSNYIRRLPFWQWMRWDLDLPQQTLLPISANLFILVLGLATAIRKRGVTGLLPIAYGQAHILVNAVARTSGGRYLLPVDWIWILYYAIGLGQLLLGLMHLVSKSETPRWLVQMHKGEKHQEQSPTLKRKLPRDLAFPMLTVLLLGAVMPVGERLFPHIYPGETPQVWLDQAVDLSGLGPQVESLLSQPETLVLHGRSLYPRYYGPGEGALGSTFPNLYPAETTRVSFFVAGPTSSGVLLSVETIPEVQLSHGEDVLVIGCRVNTKAGAYLEAYLAYFPESGTLLTRDGLAGMSGCPTAPAP